VLWEGSPMSKTTRVAMIGGGAMGGAIAEGLVSLDGVVVTIVEANPERAQWWRDRGDVRVAELADALSDADVVFLAVKPHQIVDTLHAAQEHLPENVVVVSIAAGITLNAMQQELPAGMSVIRSMPNTPVRVGKGVVGLSAGSACSQQDVDLVSTLLSSVSLVAPIEEELLDSLTATSGSGPAYLFYLAEAMKLGAMDLGLPEETANALVANTLSGAAELLLAEPDKAVELRASVTSKGGTTAAATAVFDAADLRGIVVNAMRANRDRARELAVEAN
jgi:pyrroline-5-carboxylate reductase